MCVRHCGRMSPLNRSDLAQIIVWQGAISVISLDGKFVVSYMSWVTSETLGREAKNEVEVEIEIEGER